MTKVIGNTDKARFDSLMDSLNEHVRNGLTESDMLIFNKMAKDLSSLDIKECIAQYAKPIDDFPYFDIDIILPHDVEVSLNKFIEKNISDTTVDFILWKDKTVILCGEMELGEMISRIKETMKIKDER